MPFKSKNYFFFPKHFTSKFARLGAWGWRPSAGREGEGFADAERLVLNAIWPDADLEAYGLNREQPLKRKCKENRHLGLLSIRNGAKMTFQSISFHYSCLNECSLLLHLKSNDMKWKTRLYQSTSFFGFLWAFSICSFNPHPLATRGKRKKEKKKRKKLLYNFWFKVLKTG